MLAQNHRKAAENIEKSIAKLQPDVDPDMARLAIEGAWGAAFQWIAFGCETRYGKHQNNHTRLNRFLKDLGEKEVAEWWESLDRARQGGWYGGDPVPTSVQGALALLKQIRLWATQYSPGSRTVRERFGPMRQDLSVIPPWLDEETRALVRDKVELLAERHPDVLAIILYGSVARHEERPLDEPDPSDVDLLVVLDSDRDAIWSQGLALTHTMGLAEDRHLNAPREVKVMFSSRTSQEWDPEFIENVRRDGIVLYKRGELPAPFAA